MGFFFPPESVQLFLVLSRELSTFRQRIFLSCFSYFTCHAHTLGTTHTYELVPRTYVSLHVFRVHSFKCVRLFGSSPLYYFTIAMRGEDLQQQVDQLERIVFGSIYHP